MRLVIFSYLVLSPIVLNAQTYDLVEQYTNQADSVFKVATSSDNWEALYEALELYVKATAAEEKCEIPRVENLILLYSRVTFVSDEYACCETKYQIKKLELYQEIYEPSDERILELAENIGYSFDAFSNMVREGAEFYPQAKEYYQLVIDLCTEHDPDNILVIARNEYNLGNICANWGDFAEAISHFEKAKPVYKDHFGTEHEDYKELVSKLSDAIINSDQ